MAKKESNRDVQDCFVTRNNRGPSFDILSRSYDFADPAFQRARIKLGRTHKSLAFKKRQLEQILERKKEQQFEANLRLLLVDRMKQFKQESRGQKKYCLLNLTEDQIRLYDVVYLLGVVHSTSLNQKRHAAAATIQAFVRRVQYRVRCNHFLGAILKLQKFIRSKIKVWNL